jgi:glyoxylase-like metal-dependent hydrolase (beta-lactamase superfamily II)
MAFFAQTDTVPLRTGIRRLLQASLQGLVVLAVLGVLSSPTLSQAQPQPTTQVALEKDGVKVHAFIAPMTSNATYVIESANALVLVDSQFMVPFAKAFRAYADGLGKPIERVIITHAHPDHFYGLAAAFADVDSYALAGVQQFISKVGPKMLEGHKANPKMKDMTPDTIVAPSKVLEPGTATIDGVKYEFVRLTGGESSEELLIKLPDLGVLLTGDLAYNNLHLFLATGDAAGWIALLEQLQALEGYDTVLPGHGEPGNKDLLAANIAYLKEAGPILSGAKDVADLKAKLTAKFPNIGGAAFIDLYGSMYFKAQAQKDKQS